MDDALVQEKTNANKNAIWVLILVLMDDALVPECETSKYFEGKSLNPCFNG